MIHTGYESYTVQELQDRMPEGPLFAELVNRLQAREDLDHDVQKALSLARELEAAALALVEDHNDGMAAQFLEALADRLKTLEGACTTFREADPGE